MMAFRTRVLLYILTFLLFIVLWSQWRPAPGSQQTERRTPSRPTVSAEAETTAADLLPAPDYAPLAGAPPVARTSTAEPLVVGGLTRPEISERLSEALDPLAVALRQSLAATLLDPQSGQAEDDSLASSWTIDDGLITFTLRPDVDSTAVLMALRAAQRNGQLPDVSSLRVSGRSLELTVARDRCAPLWRIATWPVVLAEPESIDEDRWLIPGESGDWLYRQYVDEAALRQAWERGEINALLGVRELVQGPPLVDGGFTSRPGELLATLLFNLEDDLLQEQALRDALVLATDREALLQDAYGGVGALLDALLPPGHWAAPRASLAYDPERAAARLTELGWRDRDGDGLRENESGDPVSIQLILPLSGDHRWESLAHLLARQWAEVGLRVEPRFLSSYSAQERLYYGQWQVALVAYHTRGDPDQLAMWRAPSENATENELNVTGYDRPALEALFEEASRVPECDFGAQQALYHRAWETLLEDKPLWPLFALPMDLWVRSDAVPGF